MPQLHRCMSGKAQIFVWECANLTADSSRLHNLPIPDRKHLVAHRALVRLRIIDADDPGSARWTFPFMLPHTNHWSQQRSKNSEHNHRHAKKNTPPEQAKQNARKNQDRSCNDAEIQTAKRAARRVMLVLARVYFTYHSGSAIRAEGPRRCEMIPAL
jgi:hypothetical protein